MALLDFMQDPMTQLGASLLAGQSPYAGVNIGNAFMQVGQLQQAQQMAALKAKAMQQELEGGALDLKAKKQSAADSDTFRSATPGVPSDPDPYKDALLKYQYYQAKGVPPAMLKPYIDQMEKLKGKYHVVAGNLVAEPSDPTGKGASVYEAPAEMKVAPGGVAYNPKTLVPGSFLTGPESDVIPDPNNPGKWIPNPAKITLAQAKRPQVSVSVDTGEKPFLKDFGAEQSKQFFQMRDAATKAQTGLQGLNNMREAIDSGAWQGGGANTRAAIANYLKPLGFEVDQNKLANTQAFASAAGKAMLNHAKDLGANPSNADAARIEKIIGNADTDPGAMKKMLDWQEEMYRKTIKNYNQTYDQVKKNPAVFNAWDLGIKEPDVYQGKSSNPGATTYKFDSSGNPL